MHLRTKFGTPISSGLTTKIGLTLLHRTNTSLGPFITLLHTRPFCCSQRGHIYIDLLIGVQSRILLNQKYAFYLMCHMIPDVLPSHRGSDDAIIPMSATRDSFLVTHLSQLKKVCFALSSIPG